MTNQTKRKRKFRDFFAVLRKYNISRNSDAHSIRLALEELGPTYVKLGQILSTRSDVFPPELCMELSNLRDEVAPMPPEDVDKVIFEAYGKPKEELFAYFEEEAHGSASISQVHRATLLTGEEVAVKIQRIGALENMEMDIEFLRRLLRRMPFVRNNPYVDLGEVIDELHESTNKELDFNYEAENLARFYELNEEVNYATCPKVYPEFKCPTVLVMEYVDGISIMDTETLEANGYDMTEIGHKYTQSFFKQTYIDGFFQADPHIGNIKIRDGQIVWYDMGIMGEFSEYDRANFLKFMEGLVTADHIKCYDAICRMLVFNKGYDNEVFYKDLTEFISSLENISSDKIDPMRDLQRLFRLAKDNNVAFNPAHTIMSRALITVDGTLKQYFPEVDLFDEVRKFAMGFMTDRSKRQFEDRDIVRIRRVAAFGKVAQIPLNIANMVEQYSKGLSPVKMEMSFPEKTKEFMMDMVRIALDALAVITLLICSTIVLQTGLKPIVFGMPVLSLIGYGIAAFKTLAGLISRSGRRKKKKK